MLYCDTFVLSSDRFAVLSQESGGSSVFFSLLRNAVCSARSRLCSRRRESASGVSQMKAPASLRTSFSGARCPNTHGTLLSPAVLQRRSRELHEAREALRKSLHRERKIARLQSQFIRMAGRELDTLMLSIDATSARIARNTQSQNAGWIRNKCMSIQTTVTRVRVIIERTLHMADEQQLNRD